LDFGVGLSEKQGLQPGLLFSQLNAE